MANSAILAAIVTIGGALLGAGCAEKSAAPSLDTPSAAAPGAPGAPPAKTNPPPVLRSGWNATQAQPKLSTLKLFVGPEVITAELAMTEAQIRTGMMFRESMAENDGMLFVFARPYRPAFYMRNTKVPLTAAYIDPDGVIQELVELRPFDETPVEAKSDNIQFVLEMNQGWFNRHQVSTGAVVTTELGPLRQAFR